MALFVAAAATSAAAQDVLAVTPKEFEPSLAAWRAHREKLGMKVAAREPGADVGATVRDAWEKSGRKLRFVMLVGDVEKVPCALVPRKAAETVAMMEPDPNIATDAPYADVDGDGVPDLAIGRVPADTPAEVKDYLDRVVAYETDADFGDWRRKLDVVAGTGGYGPLVDMALESLTKDLLSALSPAVDVTMTYANPFSAYCPPPAEFADYAVKRWNEGALVVAYVGHGSTRNVDSCRFGKQEYPILGMDQVAKIGALRGAPVSMFVACSTGHIDGARDCLAEEMVKRPKGPVAVIASSRVSSPYSNGVIAKELLDALYKVEAPTAGELLTAVKKRLLDPPEGDAVRARLEKMGEMFAKDPAVRRADREDHVLLYNLLGDPSLVIARPGKLDVSAPAEATPGTKLRVTGRAAFDGTATVELIRRKEPMPKLPPGGKKTPEQFREAYDAANSHGVAKVEVAVKAGEFTAEVPVPADAAAGPAAVRVFLSGKAACAAGGADLAIGSAK
jgi:peptidase C25-like protein